MIEFYVINERSAIISETDNSSAMHTGSKVYSISNIEFIDRFFGFLALGIVAAAAGYVVKLLV